METICTNKSILVEWCKENLSTHTDWTGTRVETKFECESVEKFINILWEYIDLNHERI